ncbi:MAG: hypothetical protein AAB361_02660 [Patescibacteria group bacterium]
MKERGITLVEIIVTIFIITLFSGIIISDFPKIKKQFALSSATHKLAQDLRRAQDMGLSGTQPLDPDGNPLLIKGFGLYINLNPIDGNNKQYIIYGDKNGNQQYDPLVDYNLDLIDMDIESKGVIIKGLYNALEDRVSINFSPPNPKTSISNLDPGFSRIKIVLSLEYNSAVTREIYVNTSGLIETK